MKQKQVLCTVTTVVLMLLFSLSVPAALAGEAENTPVDWGLSPADMMALEGVTQDSLYVVEGGGYTQYGLIRLDREYTYVTVYVYQGDRLVMYGENASSVMQRAATDFAAIYEKLLPGLLEEYGDPAIDDTDRMIQASNTVEEGAILPEDIVSAVGWDFGDGTALFHLHVKSADEESVITIFVNETALYAE